MNTIYIFIFLSINVTLAVCILKLNNSDIIDKYIEGLTRVILKTYFTENKCIIFISEQGLFNNLHKDLGVSVIHLTTNSGDCNTDLSKTIADGIQQHCDGYVVQLANPECFLKSWYEAFEITFSRNCPKVLFLPTYPYKDYAYELFNLEESDLTFNVVAVEVDTDNISLKDGNGDNNLMSEQVWPFKLWRSNYSIIAGTSERNKVYLDSWNPRRGFLHNNELYFNELSDLEGREFRVVTFPYLPYAQVKENCSRAIDCLDGFEVRICVEFCRIYNCTIGYRYDGQFWGVVYGNGTGDGLFGMVYKNEGDAGMAANYLWLEPAPYVDYTDTYLYGAVTLLVPKPVPLSGWRIPFLPFDSAMWCLYVFTFFVTALAIFIALWFLRKLNNNNKSNSETEATDFKGILLITLGMSVLQPPSNSITKDHTSLNMIVTSTAMLWLLTASGYSAGLSSILTVPLYTKPVDTFQELAKSGLIWIAYHEAYTYSLRNVDDENVKTVVRNFRVLSFDRLIVEARKGIYGLTIERAPGGYFEEQEQFTDEVISKHHLMKENIFGSPLLINLRKGSPYTKPMNNVIHKLVSSGIIQYWVGAVSRKHLHIRKQMAIKESTKIRSSSNEPTILKVSHIHGPFMVYLAGTVFSFIAILTEIISNKFVYQKNQSKHKPFFEKRT